MADGTIHADVSSLGGGGSAMFSQERVRTGGNLTLQYRPSDSIKVTSNALESIINNGL